MMPPDTTTIEFALPIQEQATLNGQMDVPGNEASYPVVLMVPGGWFMERDGFMGNTYTSADLMYKRLADSLIAQGVAVVRYDNRGVSGNELSIGLNAAQQYDWEATKRYFAQCVDDSMRITVTPESWQDDIERVFQWMVQQPQIDTSNMVIWAHSEGGLHVARLIEAERLKPQPKGLCFVGSITESPKSILRWQLVDRFVDAVMELRDANDEVPLSAITLAMENEDWLPLSAGLTIETLTPPHPRKVWDRQSLVERLSEEYMEVRRDTLERDDTDPFPVQTDHSIYISASYRWWKQWFLDDKDVLASLAHFDGNVSFHFGELDSQAPAEREAALVKRGTHHPRIKTRIHTNRGHALRTGEPTSGPMDEEAAKVLIEDILAQLKE